MKFNLVFNDAVRYDSAGHGPLDSLSDKYLSELITARKSKNEIDIVLAELNLSKMGLNFAVNDVPEHNDFLRVASSNLLLVGRRYLPLTELVSIDPSAFEIQIGGSHYLAINLDVVQKEFCYLLDYRKSVFGKVDAFSWHAEYNFDEIELVSQVPGPTELESARKNPFPLQRFVLNKGTILKDWRSPLFVFDNGLYVSESFDLEDSGSVRSNQNCFLTLASE